MNSCVGTKHLALCNDYSVITLFTLSERLSSYSEFSVVRVFQSLVFCVVFCRSCFGFFSFGNCIVCRFIITPLVLVSLKSSFSKYTKEPFNM